MVYDCFSFFNELDVLEIRLNVLKDVVDRFVIVEAAWTHTGKAKEFLFAKNRARYADFLDRIIYVKLTEDPVFPEGATAVEKAWIRENTQRNAIIRGLKDASGDDFLIISDLDEIANPFEVKQVVLSQTNAIISLRMRLYYYYLNFRNASVPYWNYMPKMLKVATFYSLDSYAKPNICNCAPSVCNEPPSATLMRMAAPDAIIDDGGWHFSFQGGVDKVVIKLGAIVEGEEVICYNGGKEHLKCRIDRLIKTGRGVWGGHERFVAEPVGKNLPKYVVENQEKYAHMLMGANERAYARTRFLRWYAPKIKVVHDLAISLAIRVTPRFLVPIARRLRSAIGV